PAIYTLSLHDALPISNCFMWISVSGQRTGRHGTRSVLRFKLPGEIVRPGAAWRRLQGQVQVPPWVAEGGRIHRFEKLGEGRFTRMYTCLRCPALSIGVTAAGSGSPTRQRTPTAVNSQC